MEPERKGRRRIAKPEVVETSEVTDNSLEEATQFLRDIWADFWRGPQGPEDKRKRQMAIAEILDILKPEIVEYLTEPGEGGMSLLGKIRDETRREVSISESSQRREEIKRPSRGQAIAIRRQKAQQRRGTDPRDIH